MGLELKKCKATIKDVDSIGKLHVDSKALEFRAGDVRWTVKVGKGTSAKVNAGELTVRRGSKSATFVIGTKADKWADKILNPPSRGKKLGLKEGDRYFAAGTLEKSFIKELEGHGLIASKSAKSCRIAFIKIESSKQLKGFEKLLQACAAGVHVWAIWPKGVESVSQTEVIATAKKFGIGPGKGISFDEVDSAMRFTKKA